MKTKFIDLLVWIAIFLFPLIFIATVVGYNYQTFNLIHQNNLLAKEGAEVKGKVLESLKLGSGLEESYYIRYQFNVLKENKEEVEYEKKRKVDYSTWYSGDMFNKVNVLYLEKNPKISNIKYNNGNDEPIVICILLDLTLLIVGFFLFRQHKKQKNKA